MVAPRARRLGPRLEDRDREALRRRARRRRAGLGREGGEGSRPLPYRGEGPPVGFAWGRVGIGARELSRSILLDATGNAMLAERHCRELTHQVISRLPEPRFELDREDVLAWIAR